MPTPARFSVGYLTYVTAHSSDGDNGNRNPSTSAVRCCQWFGHTENEDCGLQYTKFLGCRPISVDQLAVGAERCITDASTVHQPAEDRDACT